MRPGGNSNVLAERVSTQGVIAIFTRVGSFGYEQRALGSESSFIPSTELPALYGHRGKARPPRSNNCEHGRSPSVQQARSRSIVLQDKS
jgi:hypothetical protein